MSLSFEVEFMGGPLDGIKLVHPEQNYILQLAGDPSGYYEYRSDLRYYWIDKQSKLFNEPF